MKNRKLMGILIMISIVAVLWFSGFLPMQIAKVVASNYMSKQENGDVYRIKDTDYSSAHDCYFVYFDNTQDTVNEARNIGIYYRYLPIYIFFDSAIPKL